MSQTSKSLRLGSPIKTEKSCEVRSVRSTTREFVMANCLQCWAGWLSGGHPCPSSEIMDRIRVVLGYKGSRCTTPSTPQGPVAAPIILNLPHAVGSSSIRLATHPQFLGFLGWMVCQGSQWVFTWDISIWSADQEERDHLGMPLISSFF